MIAQVFPLYGNVNVRFLLQTHAHVLGNDDRGGAELCDARLQAVTRQLVPFFRTPLRQRRGACPVSLVVPLVSTSATLPPLA